MIPLPQILFLDIETVPLFPSFQEADERTKALWGKKTTYLRKEQSAEGFYERAGIWAEFGKIVCICLGYYSETQEENSFRIKALFGDELEILQGLNKVLNLTSPHSTNSPRFPYLCAHNGKEFDFPFLCRRMLVHALPLPPQLNLAGKKPWEINHLDTMNMWAFGDYKNFTSLDLLAHLFGLESPKDEIDGSMVSKTYYEDNDIEKIAEYCKKDVITLFKIYLRLVNVKKNFNIINI